MSSMSGPTRASKATSAQMRRPSSALRAPSRRRSDRARRQAQPRNVAGECKGAEDARRFGSRCLIQRDSQGYSHSRSQEVRTCDAAITELIPSLRDPVDILCLARGDSVWLHDPTTTGLSPSAAVGGASPLQTVVTVVTSHTSSQSCVARPTRDTSAALAVPCMVRPAYREESGPASSGMKKL